MINPRDTLAAFDRIAAEIEPLLIRLGRAAPGAALDTVRDEITALLDGAGLRWSDVAARVAAPSPSRIEPTPFRVPPMPPTPQPGTGPKLPPDAVLTNEQLKQYGYRTEPGRSGYGYENTPVLGADGPTSHE